MRMLNTDVNNMIISDQYVSSGLDLFDRSSRLMSFESLHCQWRSTSAELAMIFILTSRPASLSGGAMLSAILKDNNDERASLFDGLSLIIETAGCKCSYCGSARRTGVCRGSDAKMQSWFPDDSPASVRGLFLPLLEINEKGLDLFIRRLAEISLMVCASLPVYDEGELKVGSRYNRRWCRGMFFYYLAVCRVSSFSFLCPTPWRHK